MPEPSSVPATREIYGRAPVVEAAIDIRCINRPTFAIADLASVSATLSDTFDEEADLFEREVELHADGTKRVTERPVGVMLRGREKPQTVVQLQIGGAAFSRLSPYERWEPFRDDAKKIWEVYARAATPQVVNRVGVRYINSIEVGTTIDDLRAFLNVYPVAPWKLASPPAGFSLQVRNSVEDVNLVINEGTTRHAETKQFGILLDIDAFVQHEALGDMVELWNVVERLHVVVEEAFERSITDRTRELIR